MKELTLRGSFHEMGVQYGRACAKEIKTFAKMAYVMASLAHKPGSQPFNPNMWYILPTFLTYKKEKSKWQQQARAYEPLIKEHHPDALDFMRGIAAGTGLSYVDILSMNLASENMLTCSIWGASGTSTKENEPLIGMTADEEPATEKYELFLDYQPDHGYRYKVTAFTGWAGYNHGMNETGLAVASTLLFLKPPQEEQVRTPILVFLRILNTCATVEEAKAFFETLPDPAVGSVFYIADREKFMRVEGCPAGREYEIVENGSLGNTNLATTETVKPFDAIPILKQSFNAKTRAKRMATLLREYDGRIDPEVMHRIASDHGEEGTDTWYRSMCQHPRFLRYNFKTLVAFVAQPRHKRFWIYEGNPCENRVKEYRFT